MGGLLHGLHAAECNLERVGCGTVGGTPARMHFVHRGIQIQSIELTTPYSFLLFANVNLNLRVYACSIRCDLDHSRHSWLSKSTHRTQEYYSTVRARVIGFGSGMYGSNY